MRQVPDAERRSRLARRHALSPEHRVADPFAAATAMTALHATEPATVYLSLHARVEAMTVDDVERTLYRERTLVKQLAMRRTLFAFPRDLLPAVWGSAAARVAVQQRNLIAKDIERHGVADDGSAWVERACAAVLDRLADGSALSAVQLREELPELEGRTRARPGTSYLADVPFAPRVLTLLGARGQIVRGQNAGHWRLSRPAWTTMSSWLGEVPEPLSAAQGYAEITRRWLWTFGPATTADLGWWLGSTKGAATRALADVAAVPVQTSSGAAWLLPTDTEPEPEAAPWAALLPVLDPTVMGWKQRDFLLGPHAEALFDRNGNAGTTAWWDGRVVGAWVQDPDGVVEVRLLEDVPAEARAALEVEARRLTGWLAGTRVGTVYPSPLMKGLWGMAEPHPG